MFSLYEAIPSTVNAFYYTYDLPVTTAVDTLTKSGLFTEVTATNDVITLSRNGSDYKLKHGTVVILQGADNFSLVDDVTFFTQYAELITVEASEFEKLIKRVDMLEKLLKVKAGEKTPTPKKSTTAKKDAQKVEKELDTPTATE